MRTFLSLAFRNIFRSRRRTAMMLLVVAGGVSALLLAGGYFSYIFWGFRETTIRNGLGHLQIFNARSFDHDETRVLENGLTSYENIRTVVQATPHVTGVAPRIEFYGMVSNGQKSGTYMGTAVVPAAERKMHFVPDVLKGRWFNLEGSESEVIVGAGLARSMNVKPGDGLTLLAVTADGALNGIDVDVVGVITTHFKELDDRLLQMTLPAAQRLLQTDRVTKLVVGLDKTENTQAVRAVLASRLAGSEPKVILKDWQELSPMYKQIVLMFGGILAFMGVIIFFMVVMSSSNTMMMAMFERTREVGTMLAMGTPRAWVVGLFVLEGALTGVLGAAAGLLAGNAIAALLNRAHIQLPPPPGNSTGFPLRIFHVPEYMVLASILVVLTLAAASIPPAWRASRLKVVEALSHV
jgi:putative ABC transport system permease protein